MFCPKCGAYLKEKDLVKSKVIYTPDNIALEYDARCPDCRVELGHISWGKFTLNPRLGAQLDKGEPESRSLPESGDEMKSERVKICPHCGKELPPGL